LKEKLNQSIVLLTDTGGKWVFDNIGICLLKLKSSKPELNPANSKYADSGGNKTFQIKNFRRFVSDKLQNSKNCPLSNQKERQKD